MKKQYSIKKLLIASSVGILMTAISASALAGWGRDHGERIVDKVTKELKLSTEQQDKLQEVATAFSDARKTMRDQHEDQESQNENEAKMLLSKNNLLPEDIMGYMTSMHGQRLADMQQSFKPVVTQFVAFHASLDEEQRLKLADMMAERMGYFGNHHRKGRRHYD